MAIYLDDTQRNMLSRLAASWTWRTQWPTWALIAAIYGGWFSVATHARDLGLPVTTLLLALLGTWYMSLQHELLHGHPTRSPLVNALLGFAPLAVCFPYGIYRDSHLQHHDDPHLTHPERDPESYFVGRFAWQRAGWAIRALLTFRNTFVGRLLVGPAFAIAATGVAALRRIKGGDWRDVPVWLAHFAALAALTAWLQHVCAIPAWVFIVGAGYGSLSVGSVRSFQEHRAAQAHEHRTVINEAAWFWRLLFLNNNYHLVHHDLPHVPWFALRRVYEASREQYVARSGGFLVRGYSEWLRLYALAAVAHPVYEDASGLIQHNPSARERFAEHTTRQWMSSPQTGTSRHNQRSGGPSEASTATPSAALTP
ncbi:fatty acid desaturase family protein [Paraburkholderia xenovorans LB400]|uniref:Fatty acid desaturase n=1 Tax=Paraburkholderia xenovorans (strain LB400) TaxID=266265 RepID=Q13LU4_PARXL|nr:fatty acid desaturase [Paraburkholderia xenovorans]ABE34945.1 putative fatty acid desaturase [Paraburkholderia xenovorans LB400]AIP37066.1 fatty acid desaturase family protein [Paraburkholderia xenovorans LB400]